MLVALVLLPILFAIAAFAITSARVRPLLVPAAAVLHTSLTIWTLVQGEVAELDGWLALDPLNRIVLPLVSVLYLACALYVPGYLRLRGDRPNRVFCLALLVFLAMMTLMVTSHHLGLMWIALEANTLASAPLLFFNRTPRSLEATWKYILIGGVGVALALLGSFFLAYAALHAGLHTTLLVDDLVLQAGRLSRPWLHAAFVVLFVGYGTKMGLAPMHTWKPDAYGEAPGLVGALLAGGLTTCAFLGLLRFYQICSAAGERAFAAELMLVIGLLSMAIGAVFMARQRDYKRMLAYSSVEHMGIVVLGVAIGGMATFGALLHLVANALTKGAMFLAAANIHRAFGSKTIDGANGALRRVPASAALFLVSFFAATGTPPFALFVSELTILRTIIADGRHGLAVVFLLLLFAVFVGMGGTVLAVVLGRPAQESVRVGFTDRLGTVGPPLLLMAAVLTFGLYLPPFFDDALHAAAAYVEPPR